MSYTCSITKCLFISTDSIFNFAIYLKEDIYFVLYIIISSSSIIIYLTFNKAVFRGVGTHWTKSTEDREK